MIARRFTLICMATALAGALLAIALADAGRSPRPWQQAASCDAVSAPGC